MEYDVNQPSSDGKTALQYAIENNHLAVVKVLFLIDNPDIREFLQRPTGILPNLT